ncbi:MAG: hypothetical protein LBE17_05815 [Treponema sp.]|jgi:hypothetical protein|nr:hypothetical protein [Treponema sp.]
MQFGSPEELDEQGVWAKDDLGFMPFDRETEDQTPAIERVDALEEDEPAPPLPSPEIAEKAGDLSTHLLMKTVEELSAIRTRYPV